MTVLAPSPRLTPALPASRRSRVKLDVALLALAALATLFVVAFPDSPGRPLTVFVAAMLVPGGAVLTRLRVRDPGAFVGLSIAISLAIEAAVSTALVWARWFDPDVLGLALLAIALPLLAIDLLRLRTDEFRETTEIPVAVLPADEPSDGPSAVWVVVSLVALAAVVVVWALSLSSIDLYHLDDYGLSKELPATWLAALGAGALGAALVTIVPRRPNGWVVAAWIGVVAVILYGTLPLLAEQPHYAWVYKHIGVTRYITEAGRVDPSIDIYNRWPGMFAFSAMLGSLAGRDNPVNYAAWAELFFAVSNMLVIGAIARAISRDTRVAGGAALLFLLSNWVGQGYYSPQAFAFLLSLTVLYVAVRHLSGPLGRGGEWLVRLIGKVVRKAQATEYDPLPEPWPRWAAVLILLVLDAVLVISHQLTPYVVIVQLLGLALFGPFRPAWIVGASVGLTVLYLLPNLDYVSHNFGLFTSFDPFNNARHSSLYDIAPMKGKQFNAQAGRLLTFGLWASAAAGALILARRGLARRALPVAILAAAPFAVIFGQNYGGEASLRVMLFTSPWMATLAAWAIAGFRRSAVRAVLLGALALGFAAAFVPSYFGAEEINSMPKGQVVASQYFYDHAEPHSVLLLSGPNFPVRYGGNYREFAGPQSDFDPNLLRVDRFRYRDLGAGDIGDVVSLIHQYAGMGYIVFSTSQLEYAKVFQLTAPNALNHLETAVSRSPYFTLWFKNGDTRIYALTPAAGRTMAPGGATG